MCMLHHNQNDPADVVRGTEHDATPWYKTRFGVILLLLLGIAGYFLWTEHRAHVIGFLPYTLLLLCPLIHVFMHRGHNNRGSGTELSARPHKGHVEPRQQRSNRSQAWESTHGNEKTINARSN